MRRVLLGLLGMMAAGGTCAEEYSFSALIQDTYPDQTIIQCDGPGALGGCQNAARCLNGPLRTRTIKCLGALPLHTRTLKCVGTLTEWLVRLGIRLSFIPTARWPSVCWTLSSRWMLPVLASRYP